MEQFAYSFAITMLHSIWQMALLLSVYEGIVFLFKTLPSLAKRNLLYSILGMQVATTVISFYLIHSRPTMDFRINIHELLNNFSATQSWLKFYAETIFWLYVVMVMFRLANSLISWVHFRQHYPATLIKPSIGIRLFTQIKAHHFGIQQRVSIWCSNTIHTPITFGFWKPVILLPIALVNQLSIEQTETLIIHELTHIKNNDYLLNWMLVIIEALYFFNPFIIIIAQKIKLEREKNCDEKVLQFNYPAIGYAETLMQAARQQQKAYTLQMSAVKNTTQLLKRIQFFTGNGLYNHKQNNRFLYAVFALMVFVLMNMIIAGYFLRNHRNSPSIENKSPLVAMPATEWNKNFTSPPFTKTNTVNSSATWRTTKQHATITAKTTGKIKAKPAAPGLLIQNEETVLLTSVVLTEPIRELNTEIIIKEEVSSGRIITRIYQVKNVNGETVLEPIWMTAELKPKADSLKTKLKPDSNFYKLIPAIQ